MDEDLRISKALEEQEEKKTELEIKKALDSPNSKESKDTRNLLLLLGTVLSIFVLTFAGFKVYDHFTSATVINVDDFHQKNLDNKLKPEEGYVYNGFSFVKAEGLWWTEINRFGTIVKIPLHFGPKEVESIPLTGKISPEFNQGEEVFIAINPNVTDKFYTLSISELSFNVVKGLERTPRGSCTEENWACENRTIIDCENSQGKPVIELDLNEKPGIELMGTCIKVSGSNYDIVKAVDRLLYKWYGIMT